MEITINIEQPKQYPKVIANVSLQSYDDILETVLNKKIINEKETKEKTP